MSSFEIVPWTGFGDKAPELFLSDEYTLSMRQAYGYEYCAVAENGVPILPFSPLVDCYGSRIVSLPFCDYISHATDRIKLIHAIDLLISTYPKYKIVIKSRGEIQELEQSGFDVTMRGVNHRVHLEIDHDALFANTNKAFRKGVNKALRHDISAKPYVSREALDIFYAMLTDLRRNKFSVLPHPLSHYAALFNNFISKGKGAIWIAQLGETPIAAAFFMEHNGILYDKMGVSNMEYQEYRPNNLLLWEVFKSAKDSGLSAVDMGYSNESNSGIMRFKDGLGGVGFPVRYYTYYPDSYDRVNEEKVSQMMSRLINIVVSSDASDDIVHSVSAAVYSCFC